MSDLVTVASGELPLYPGHLIGAGALEPKLLGYCFEAKTNGAVNQEKVFLQADPSRNKRLMKRRSLCTLAKSPYGNLSETQIEAFGLFVIS